MILIINNLATEKILGLLGTAFAITDKDSLHGSPCFLLMPSKNHFSFSPMLVILPAQTLLFQARQFVVHSLSPHESTGYLKRQSIRHTALSFQHHPVPNTGKGALCGLWSQAGLGLNPAWLCHWLAIHFMNTLSFNFLNIKWAELHLLRRTSEGEN